MKKGVYSEKLNKQNGKLLKIIREENSNDDSSKATSIRGNKLLCEFKKKKQEKMSDKYSLLRETKSSNFAFAKDLWDTKDFTNAVKDVPPTEIDVIILYF